MRLTGLIISTEAWDDMVHFYSEILGMGISEYDESHASYTSGLELIKGNKSSLAGIYFITSDLQAIIRRLVFAGVDIELSCDSSELAVSDPDGNSVFITESCDNAMKHRMDAGYDFCSGFSQRCYTGFEDRKS